MSTNYIITSNGSFISEDELYHYGVPGMKWGVRKQQTAVGLARTARRQSQAMSNRNSAQATYKQAKIAYRQAKKEERNSLEAKAERKAKVKRAAKIGAAVAATALAAYGAYKLNKYVKTKNGEIAAKRGYDHANKFFKMMSDSQNDYILSGAGRKVRESRLMVNPGAQAIADARAASRDNFRTAAKNVVNYKRSGGSLKNLQSVGSYINSGTDEWRVKMRR